MKSGLSFMRILYLHNTNIEHFRLLQLHDYDDVHTISVADGRGVESREKNVQIIYNSGVTIKLNNTHQILTEPNHKLCMTKCLPNKQVFPSECSEYNGSHEQ